MLTKTLKEFDIPVVGKLTFTGDANDLIEYTRPLSGIEGFVVEFENGHRVKIKADEYVRIHKVKDKIRSDRHILALLLENELDDIYPHLDETDFEKVKLFESNFHSAFKETALSLVSDVGVVCRMAEDKKDLAVNILPKSTLEGFGKQIAFRVYDRMHEDGFDLPLFVNEELMKYVKSRLGNTARYEEMADFMSVAKLN